MFKAIVLCAGTGSRMGQKTTQMPKCLIEIRGKPILEHQLSVYRSSGVTDVTLCTGHGAVNLKPYGLAEKFNPSYLVSNMVYSLSFAAELFDGEKDIIISYGDIVFSEGVLNNLMASKGSVSVVIDREWRRYWQARFEDYSSDIESLMLDSDKNHIVSIGQEWSDEEEIEGQYIGLIKVSREAQALWRSRLTSLASGGPHNTYMTGFLQSQIDSGQKIFPVFTDNDWLEFDCSSDLDPSLHRFMTWTK